MKYAQKIKAPKEVVEDALHEICIVEWDTEYRVFWSNDDGGHHIVVAFEEEVPENSVEKLMSPYMGWRLVRLVVPKGYLAVFYPLNKKD